MDKNQPEFKTQQELEIELLNEMEKHRPLFERENVNVTVVGGVFTEVEIFVRDCFDPRNTWSSGMIEVPSLEELALAIKDWCNANYFPKTPEVRSRILSKEELQPFADRYIKAFEAGISSSILSTFRTQLWREYSEKYIPKYERSSKRYNFIDAMEDALSRYKNQKMNF